MVSNIFRKRGAGDNPGFRLQSGSVDPYLAERLFRGLGFVSINLYL